MVTRLARLIADPLVVLGIAAVSIGIALIYVPAGIIAAGAMAIVVGVALDRVQVAQGPEHEAGK